MICEQCGPPAIAADGHVVCSDCLARIERDRQAFKISDDGLRLAAEKERRERLALQREHDLMEQL